MSDPAIQRRLTAILAADVAGFSRMMSADEVGTVAVLRRLWGQIVHPAVAGYRGRVVKMMGDGMLAEFASVIDAVQCAIEVQRRLGARRRSLELPVSLRIGVNLGDVLIDGEDILGEGVNVAARLESQAPPAGVLVSDAVHVQVRGKVGIDFADAGLLTLKNIETPIRAWRWSEDSCVKTEVPVTQAAAALPVMAIGKPSGGREASPGAPVILSMPAATRPDDDPMPSLAVLPFAVMGADPEQAFLADGLAEDMLTTLAKLSGLKVIARQSSFAYQGRTIDVRQIAAELGVRYVLEGSVRRAGGRVRITVQLVDARAGTQVWAERYDRSLDDVFALQDEITLRVATELQVRLTEGEQARLRYTSTTNVEAWTLWIEGLHHSRGALTASVQIKALRPWERALELDPNSAALPAMLSFLHLCDARFGWWDDRETALRKARDRSARALAIDPDNADAYRTVAGLHLVHRDFESANAAARHLAVRCGGFADMLSFAAFILQCCGHAADSIPLMQRAMTLNPHHPANFWGHLGNGLRLAGRTQEALAAFYAYHARNPGFGLADIVMIQEQAGQLEDAQRTAAELLAARPEFTISRWKQTQFRIDSEQLARDLQSLNRVALPP